MGEFFNELKRRNVFRVAAAYLVSAWLIIQVVETTFPPFGFGDAAIRRGRRLGARRNTLATDTRQPKGRPAMVAVA